MHMYSEELKSNFEKQQASKIEEMRARVKSLKDKRLEEERQFVEKKLELAFQNQCEQMRALLIKRVTKEIVQDWGEQIKMKKRLECEEEENERMYAYLSGLDVENKVFHQNTRKNSRSRGLEFFKFKSHSRISIFSKPFPL